MQVVIAPDSRLRVKTKPVKKITPKLLQTINQMADLTYSFKDPEGVGLASTQIGEAEQYFIAKQPDNSFKVYFNPKIVSFSKRMRKVMEGCLSIPNYWGEIRRHSWVKVSYLDQSGKEIQEKLTGLNAHIFQHETDHLAGILFMDRLLQQQGKLYKVIGKDQAGDDVYQEVSL